MAPLTYPSARRDDSVVDTLHGYSVADPYRWLEDPDAAETAAFVDGQNSVTQTFLSGCSYRSAFKDRLTTLYNYEKTGCPMHHGDAYYYFHNSGLQPQSVLYKQDSLLPDAARRTFLDPNTFSTDGTVSINTFAFSESGKYFAYALSASGSDWVSIHVRETKDGVTSDLEAKPIEWAKFTSIAWTHDDLGFFYSRYAKPSTVDSDKKGTETNANKSPSIYYHRLGTMQEEDVLIHTDVEHPDQMGAIIVSDDGKYLLLHVSDGCNPENTVHYYEINGEITAANKPTFLPVFTNFDASYGYIANDGPLFWFSTTKDSPKYRIVKLDVTAADKKLVEVIPETENVIASIDIADKNKLIITYLADVKHIAVVYDLYSGSLLAPEYLPLPEGAIIASMKSHRKYSELFYMFSSFLTPGTTYRFDFSTNTHSVFRETVVNGLRGDILQTKQVFYESKDGTKIPMYLISRKDIKLDGNNPTLLYGYGGFNISITPSFSVSWLAFVQHMGGVVAIANIRGGGEYGQEKWYNQGRREKKQNVFDDFQWAAKWISANLYARPDKIAINGGSNGGLLVGACLNQAPELFGAAIAQVGVLDMYRFHKFTIGAAWVSDYGNPDKAEDFEILKKYSPLHNISNKKEYPAVLIMTGDHDDRVVPLHSHKFIAELQHTLKDNKNPLLERVETKAGHGAGKSTQQIIEDTTDKFAFVGLTLGAEWTD
ncbi:hypothetical protein BASA83_000403 [Batrachochytrium salamandrivorans]|nr:hypothetical protein BASA83_000403 [Batrachochytrium salamandrivorans]